MTTDTPRTFALIRVTTCGHEVLGDNERTIIGYDGIETYHRFVPMEDLENLLEMYADDPESYAKCETLARDIEPLAFSGIESYIARDLNTLAPSSPLDVVPL